MKADQDSLYLHSHMRGSRQWFMSSSAQPRVSPPASNKSPTWPVWWRGNNVLLISGHIQAVQLSSGFAESSVSSEKDQKLFFEVMRVCPSARQIIKRCKYNPLPLGCLSSQFAPTISSPNTRSTASCFLLFGGARNRSIMEQVELQRTRF